MFQSLLVPLDGTVESETALPLARAVPYSTGGHLHLLQVRPSDSAEAAEAASTYLAATAEDVCRGGVAADTAVRTGDAAAEIVAHAVAHACDLIVMATRAVGPQSVVALTSVAEEVVARTRCPVLLTRQGNCQPAQMRTLLVPVDGTPGGALGVAAARALACPGDSRLVLLDVVAPVPTEAFAALPGMTVGGYIDPYWEELSRTVSRAYVEGLAALLRASGATVEPRVATGSITKEIVQCAADVDADVLVMSSHSVTWPARVYASSVADQVIRHSGRPVLLVKREPPA